MSTHKIDWKLDNSETLRLITHYKKYECLWNFNSAEYKRMDLKRKAWAQLSKEFSRSIPDLKKKIKSLRTAYLCEKKRVNESRKNAISPDMVHQTTLYYYKEFSFLDPVIVLRKISNQLEEVNDTEQQELTETVHSKDELWPASTSSTQSRNGDTSNFQRKRKKSTLALDATPESHYIATREKSQESLYASFGKVIALQLEQLNRVEAINTMDQIHRVLSKNVMQSLLARNRKAKFQNQHQSSPLLTSAESAESDRSLDPLENADLNLKYE